MTRSEKSSLLTTMVLGIALWCSLSELVAPAYGKSQQQSEKDAEEDEDEEGDDEKLIDLIVPKTLLKSGYSIRIEDNQYKLNLRKVTVPFSRELEAIEIQDAGGRIVSNSNLFLGKDVLRSQRARFHSVSLNFGESYSPVSHWKKVLFDQTRLQSSLDYEYQPGLLGALISLVSQSNESSFKNGIKSTYTASQIRLGLRAVLAPFSQSDSILRRLHMGLYIGGMSSAHELKYSDLRDSVTYKSSNNGVITGYDFSHIIANNFWLQIRADMTWQMIQFKELNFKQVEAQQGYGLGVKYAF